MSTRSQKKGEKLETGYRVFNDVTEAIRWKYRLTRSGRLRLTKCPFCHGNISAKEEAEHRAQCQGANSQAPTRLSPVLRLLTSRRPRQSTEPKPNPKTKATKKKKDLKTWRCFICGTSVLQSKHAAHMRQVHGMATCKICGASVRKPNLEAHIARIHSTVQPPNPPKAVTPRSTASPKAVSPVVASVVEKKAALKALPD